MVGGGNTLLLVVLGEQGTTLVLVLQVEGDATPVLVVLGDGGTTLVLGEGGGPQAACPELSTCPRN